MEISVSVGDLRRSLKKILDLYTPKQLESGYEVRLFSDSESTYIEVELNSYKTSHVLMGASLTKPFNFLMEDGATLMAFIKKFGDKELFYFADDGDVMCLNVDYDVEMIPLVDMAIEVVDDDQESVDLTVNRLSFIDLLSQVKGYGRKSFSETSEYIFMTFTKTHASMTMTDFNSVHIASIPYKSKNDLSGKSVALYHKDVSKLFNYLDSVSKSFKEVDDITIAWGGRLFLTTASYSMAISLNNEQKAIDLTHFRKQLIKLNKESWSKCNVIAELIKIANQLKEKSVEFPVHTIGDMEFDLKKLNNFLKTMNTEEIEYMTMGTAIICRFTKNELMYFGFISSKVKKEGS